jgi:hypothetical protein
MNQREYMQRRAVEDAAEDAMASVDPDATDEVIAVVIADYLVTQLPTSRTCHLSVLHELRPRELARFRKYSPERPFDHGIGPCPLPYDWQRKNVIGISTRDRDRARQWAIDATLAGYCVFRSFHRNGSGGGQGTLAHIWERRRDEIMREAQRPKAAS